MKRLFKKCKANALKMSKIFLVLVIFATEVLSPMVVMVNAKELPKMEKGDVEKFKKFEVAPRGKPQSEHLNGNPLYYDNSYQLIIKIIIIC